MLLAGGGRSEPNALLYFWGPVQQFSQIADVSYPILLAGAQVSGAPIMCCGYASAGSAEGAWANPGWQAWSDHAPLHYPDSVLSWHLYLNGGSAHPESYEEVKRWASGSGKTNVLNGSSITEFGLHSYGDATLLSVLNTPQ